MWKFFKDFMIYGLASILGKIAAVLLMPIYTNILTKEEYGAMALITSCKGVIDIVSNLNIHSGIARDYYEEGINRKRLVSTGFLSITSLSFSILIISLLTHKFWAYKVLNLEECYILPFVIMLCSIPCGSLQSYFAILTRFKKKAFLYSIGTIIHLIIQISISIIGVVLLRKGIVSVFIAILIAEIFSIIFYAYINKEYLSFQFDKRYLKCALVFSIPTLPAILAGWLDNSFGQILIGKYISLQDLGVYSIALSLSTVFTFINIALQNIWGPFLYENYQKPDFKRQCQNLYRLFLILLLGLTVFLCLFSKEIILLLTNPGYIDASKYVTLLCIPTCVMLLFPIASSGISISRDTKHISIAYISGCLCNLISLFITIPHWGIISVPLCLGISRMVTFIYLYKVSKKSIGFQLPNYLLIILILTSFVCYMISGLNISIIWRLSFFILVVSFIFAYINRHFDLKYYFSVFQRNKNN